MSPILWGCMLYLYWFANSQRYPHIYHDRITTMVASTKSAWEKDSTNCPSSATKSIPSQQSSHVSRVCVYNSYSQLFDGQFLFQSYNPSLLASIYIHTNASKYLSVYFGSMYDEYRIHSFESDNMTISECHLIHDTYANNVGNIRLCSGEWQMYYNDAWHIDESMVSFACQDQCIKGNDVDVVNYGAFEVITFDATTNTPLYFCSECKQDIGIDLYILGYILQDELYWLIWDYGANDSLISLCDVGLVSDVKIPILTECDWWVTTNGTDFIDDDMIVHSCIYTEENRLSEFNSLAVDEESKLCVNGAYNNSINGEYLWLFYDIYTNGSVYYNINNDMFIRAFVNESNHYLWEIRALTDETVKGRCSVQYNIDTNVAYYCIHNWKIYTNGEWVYYPNMFMSSCQDVCVDGATFNYAGFNSTQNAYTNIYFNTNNSLYLYGAIYDDPDIDYKWVLDYDHDPIYVDGFCNVTQRLHINMSDNYVFNVADCVTDNNNNNWYVFNGALTEHDYDRVVTKCNAEISQDICIKIREQFIKQYTLDAFYTDFAVGFDVNTDGFQYDDLFVVEYSCDSDSIEYLALIVFTYDDFLNIPIKNIIYKLPSDSCDNKSFISIRFRIDSELSTATIYMDNIYLYYNVTNELFKDEQWSLNVYDENEFVRIVKKFDLRNNVYKYKDYNIKWSATINESLNDSIFNVQFQCDNNYLYMDNFCTLKQYDFNHDCNNSSCNIQSYNLLSECDFATEIIIKFELAQVTIDYVELTHSNPTGKIPPKCRASYHQNTTYLQTPPKQQTYSYLYYDRLYTPHIEDKALNANIVSSPNCPSSADKFPSSVIISNENKICVSNSHNHLFDGQYTFRSYNPLLNASIYMDTSTSNYLSVYSTSEHWLYLIHNIQSSNSSIAKCIISKIDESVSNDIKLCIRNWKYYYATSWFSDLNIISVPCQNLCVYGKVFQYIAFNASIRHNMYYCSDCDSGLYLFGEKIHESDAYTHLWCIGADPNTGCDEAIMYCAFMHQSDLDKNHVFSLDDCTKWIWNTVDDWMINGIKADIDLCNEQDTSFIRFNSLHVSQLQQNKVCVSGADDEYINGEYVWLFYDQYRNGSVYYNSNGTKSMYLYPFISGLNNYYWKIDDNFSNDNGEIRCKIMNVVQGYIFDIDDCVNNWEVYENGEWFGDNNISLTECQDICVDGSLGIGTNEIEDGAIFTYYEFDAEDNVKKYFCKECVSSLSEYQYDAYLFVYMIVTNGSRWIECYLAIFAEVHYVFSIDDCLEDAGYNHGYNYGYSWMTIDGGEVTRIDDDMTLNYCNDMTAICMEFQANGLLVKEYETDASYINFAIGFDVNTVDFSDSQWFAIEFSCDSNVTDYSQLTTFQYPAFMGIPVYDILYKLPPDCDNQSFISILFATDNNSATSSLYLENIYLYHGVSSELFTDQMTTDTNWNIVYSESASANLILSDSYYNLTVSGENEFVYITNTIDLTNDGYTYKDLHLEWMATTTGLSNGSIFNVEYQCDSNYLYINEDLSPLYTCILKHYDANDDCTAADHDDICSLQSFSLSSDCDFASQIILKFKLQSIEAHAHASVSAFINFIELTHSDSSGQIPPECRYQTKAPSEAPTLSPTMTPVTVEITKSVINYQYIWLSAAIFVLVVCIIIIVLHQINRRRLAVLEAMTIYIRNPMILTIGIGIYDEFTEDPDPGLDGVIHNIDSGIRRDIENVIDLFQDSLKYDIFPKYEDNDVNTYKATWRKNELMDFLSVRAAALDESQYDALVVLISCHGIDQHIITSDRKKIEKIRIHRLFSQSGKSRSIPRMFLFDCCSGEKRREHETRAEVLYDSDSEQEDGLEVKTSTEIVYKNTEQTEKQYVQKDSVLDASFWAIDENNPDYKLVTINAANEGFQSILNIRSGSFAINKFVEKLKYNIVENKNTKFLQQIMDEIQEELHDNGLQLIKAVYYNKTGNIKFVENVTIDKDATNIEMSEL